MKLTMFSADHVYGYLNFKVNFHHDLTFLVGVNGSGKTTILRLIQALLTPSFRDLLSVPFSRISVQYEDHGELVTIYSNKNKESIELSVSKIDGMLTVPNMDVDELEYIVSDDNDSQKFFEEYQLKHADHPVFQYISKASPPVVLGLERTHRGMVGSPRDLNYERERMLSSTARRGFRGRRIVKGSLAAGLMETQVLVQDAYRRLRQFEVQNTERLRETVILSAFKYSDFSFLGSENASLLPSWMEQRQMLKRKEEITAALNNIGLSGEKIRNVLEEFFQRVESLFSSMDQFEGSKNFPIEWVLNKAQIDRVTELIRIIDAHKSKVDKLFAPVNTFLQSVNAFYQDTGKALAIDTVGRLGVERPDHVVAPIDALSSGERQLLIIFAHLLFNQYSTRSNVFIIDEPELSLHLRWQEKFVEKALEISPRTQLILATHSPEIVGGYEDKSVTV